MLELANFTIIIHQFSQLINRQRLACITVNMTHKHSYSTNTLNNLLCTSFAWHTVRREWWTPCL